MFHEKEGEDLELHVAVCAQRYKALDERMQRIERVVWWTFSMLLIGMGGTIMELIIQYLKQ
jgi:hypothetical protein